MIRGLGRTPCLRGFGQRPPRFLVVQLHLNEDCYQDWYLLSETCNIQSRITAEIAPPSTRRPHVRSKGGGYLQGTEVVELKPVPSGGKLKMELESSCVIFVIIIIFVGLWRCGCLLQRGGGGVVRTLFSFVGFCYYLCGRDFQDRVFQNKLENVK